MIHLLVLATALLHLQDPVGDAVGDGTLSPPTAPIYANTADFDLQSVTVTGDAKLTVRVALGSLGNPGHLPNGFSTPVVEVYLDTGPGGAHALLPGSTMTMPPKRGWNVAIRATGDQVYAVTPQPHGDPGSWPHLPATLETQGNALVIHTQLPAPKHADVYALTGVYDPFSGDGWRPLTTSVSPWAFSSETQRAPVVDLLAGSMAAQRRAIDSGVLLPYRSPTHGVGWLALMVLGLAVAALGLVLRRRVPRSRTRRPLAALPPPASDAPARRLPSHWDEMPPTEPSFLDEREEAALWPDADSSVAQAAEAEPTATEPPARDEGAADVAPGDAAEATDSDEGVEEPISDDDWIDDEARAQQADGGASASAAAAPDEAEPRDDAAAVGDDPEAHGEPGAPADEEDPLRDAGNEPTGSRDP